MVSITNVSSGQASTYYQQDNYYAKQTGEWQGKGAEELGLTGEVQKEDFESLINGKAPDGSFQIQNGGEGQNHRAGVDITFSGGKTISIVSEVLGDTRVREAHEKAVSEALRYVEQNFSQARQTQDGITEKVDTGNLVIAKFQHDTSRELDPQIHTHAVLINATQRPDGQWRALSNEEIFQNKMLIGQIYRNELAANLKELGYSIQSDSKGLFEIQGIDQKVLDHFSQRSEQIDAKVKELKESGLYPNADPQKLREIATLGSRIAKKDVDMNVVRESWQERLQEQGYTKEQIQENIQKAAEQAKQNELNRTEPKMNEYDYIRTATRAITEQESTFTKEEILRVAGKFSIGEYRVQDIEKAFSELQHDKEIVQLGENAYTTDEMLRKEKEVIQMMQTSKGDMEHLNTSPGAYGVCAQYEQANQLKLTWSQRRGVEHILTSRDRFIGINGAAGTGKTTMLDIVRQQAEAQGYKVFGLSQTGKAAGEIEASTNIKSQTIESFLRTNQTGEQKQIWIIDEASLISSRNAYQLFTRAIWEDARVVLIGDQKQLQSIEAGRIFQDLQTNGMRTVEMTDIIRQKNEDYREIAENMAAKEIDKAFQALEDSEKIKEVQNRDERINEIVKDYISADYKDTIIVTARNSDKNGLNALIRDELKNAMELTGKEWTMTVREPKNVMPADRHFAQSYSDGDLIYSRFAGVIGRAGTEAKVIDIDQQNHKLTVRTKDSREAEIDLKKDGDKIQTYREKEQGFIDGEKIVFLKNDKRLGVKNGETAEIKNIDKYGNITVETDRGKELIFNKNDYKYFDYGYAVTDYKSQGQTAEKVIYHADTSKEVNYNQAYVATTRGREDLIIYTDDKEELKEQMKTEQEKTSTLDYEKLENSLDKSGDYEHDTVTSLKDGIEEQEHGVDDILKSDDITKSDDIEIYISTSRSLSD